MPEDIVFSTSIDKGGQGAKSLSDLKKEFKSLQSELSKTKEGTEAYQKTLERLGKVKDDIGDLRATISALNPEGKVGAFQNVAGKLAGGFQAATGAAALLGTKSEELEKTLLKVQAASAFAEGIKSLTGLTDAFKVLGAVIKSNPLFLIAGVIAAITVAYTQLKDAFSDTARETARLNEELEKQHEISSRQIKIIDREIALLEASGASEEKILEAKKRKVSFQIKELEASVLIQKNQIKEIENNNSLYESYLSVITGIQRKLGADEEADATEKLLKDNKIERSKEVRDKLEADEQAILDLKNALLVEEVKIEVKKRTEDKKTSDEKIRNMQEFLAKQAQLQEEFRVARDTSDYEAQQKANEDLIQLAKDFKKQNDDFDKEEQKVRAEENSRLHESILKNKEESDKKQLELDRQKAAERLALEQQLATGIQNISDVIFLNKINKAKKGSEEETRLAKQQFEVNKKLQMGMAFINGAQAVTAILAVPDFTLGVASALRIASAVIATGATIAKIASAKFEAPAAVSAPNIQSTGNINAPSIQPAPTIQPSTRLNEQGQNLTLNVKTELVETQATSTQERIKRLQSQASFP